jgi:nucleoside-diphosphate-sugar epimerase
MLTETVFKPLAQGKKANWMASDSVRHSFTYTPDAANATAMLGNSDKAYGEVWHLPTAPNPPTGKEWIEMIAEELSKPLKYRVVSKGMARAMGIVMPFMRELSEMMYQYDRDYVFDSSKFEQAYGVKSTPYREGIREIVRKDYL